MPDISYSFYRTYCQLYQVPYELIALSDDFSINPDDYRRPRADVPAGIILANPNAPTGMALALADLERIDRKSVVSGKRVSVRVDLGGRRINKKKKRIKTRQ